VNRLCHNALFRGARENAVTISASLLSEEM
jgi:hypothetical protein